LFSGRVDCPHIDDLAQEYDRRLLAGEAQEQSNPIPIITRRRDGLQHQHPFHKALAAAVEKPLGELIAAEEKKARLDRGREGSRLRRAFDILGRDLARLMDEDLREIQEDGLPVSVNGRGEVPPIRLIPEEVVAYMGENKTITLQVRKDLLVEEAQIMMEPEGVIQCC
jgi:hypothetical protein